MRPDSDQNFCCVFELPNRIEPAGFCFGGPSPVTFRLVDWFAPWPINENFELLDIPWSDVVERLRIFIRSKRYVIPGRRYLIITDFSESCIITC